MCPLFRGLINRCAHENINDGAANQRQSKQVNYATYFLPPPHQLSELSVQDTDTYVLDLNRAGSPTCPLICSARKDKTLRQIILIIQKSIINLTTIEGCPLENGEVRT